jgi:CRISPR-associated protein Cmr1
VNFEIQLKTPMWTAGVDPITDRLHETSLIGSMRWWYEALIRGQGDYACDPTGDRRCPEEDGKKCSVCELFGCTGEARKFRLLITESTRKLMTEKNVLIPSGRIHYPRRQNKKIRVGGWFLSADSIIGDAKLTFLPVGNVDFNYLCIILTLIESYGAIGGKVSNGYGVIKFGDGGNEIHQKAKQALSKMQPNPTSRDNELPDIRDFFFANLEFDEPTNPNWWQGVSGIREVYNGKVSDGKTIQNIQGKKGIDQVISAGILPIAPAIRNYLRFTWYPSLKLGLEDYEIFGTTKRNDNRASRINISYAYRDGGKWNFRIWGVIPCNMNGHKFNRDYFGHRLHKELSASSLLWSTIFPHAIRPKLTQWHWLDCDQMDANLYLMKLFNRGGTK